MNAVTKYTPVLGGLRREIDRLFDDMLNVGSGDQTPFALWAPRTDISQTDDRYTLRMDIPGLSKKDLNIELRDDTLTISGERKSEHENNGESIRRVERSYGRFFRSFTLPHASDRESVAARMDEGVLTIEVPKREESRPRKIDIS